MPTHRQFHHCRVELRLDPVITMIVHKSGCGHTDFTRNLLAMRGFNSTSVSNDGRLATAKSNLAEGIVERE